MYFNNICTLLILIPTIGCGVLSNKKRTQKQERESQKKILHTDLLFYSACNSYDSLPEDQKLSINIMKESVGENSCDDAAKKMLTKQSIQFLNRATVEDAKLPILDLTFISDLPSLERFILDGYLIKSFDPVKNNRNITTFTITSDQIQDYSFLADMPQIESLTISNSMRNPKSLLKIEDLSSLRKLKKLFRLTLQGLSISDLKFLEETHLNDLRIINCEFLEESPFGAVRTEDLKVLSIGNLKIDIEDFFKTKKFEKLIDLDLEYMPINTLEGVSTIEKLEYLTLVNLPLENLGPLKNLTNLRYLWISNMNINKESTTTCPRGDGVSRPLNDWCSAPLKEEKT